MKYQSCVTAKDRAKLLETFREDARRDGEIFTELLHACSDLPKERIESYISTFVQDAENDADIIQSLAACCDELEEEVERLENKLMEVTNGTE